MEKFRLMLADEKPEAVLITNQRKRNTVKVEVDGHTVIFRLAIKYLRVMVDAKLKYREHLQYGYQNAFILSLRVACVGGGACKLSKK